jgi:2-polyprenyl-3-methyl-5-hydroxy-6-metoxy-1,4-benzoquinol methylase
MKNQLIKFLSRHFYPQTVFVSSIKKYINISSQGLLIDSPCGNGETSWGFATNKHLSVFGYDIDEVSIETAQSRFNAPNLRFKACDIFEAISLHNNVDYFCIINSLFLLPDPKRIIEAVKNSLNDNGILFVIIPNIEGKNFKWFSSNGNQVNKLILAKNEITPYFNSFGLKVKCIESIVFTNNYGRKDIKLFSVFSHFYLSLLNKIQTFFKIGQPNYFLIVIGK